MTTDKKQQNKEEIDLGAVVTSALASLTQARESYEKGSGKPVSRRITRAIEALEGYGEDARARATDPTE